MIFLLGLKSIYEMLFNKSVSFAIITVFIMFTVEINSETRRIYGVGDQEIEPEPVKVGRGSVFNISNVQIPFRFVVAGYRHSYIMDNEGSLFGFGSNHHCIINDNELNTIQFPTLLKIFQNLNIVKIDSKVQHSLALEEDVGKVYSWGDNQNGKLGTGNIKEMCIPYLVVDGVSPNKAVDVSTGSCHSLVCLEGGDVLGFGCNSNFELGLGRDIVDVYTPTLLNISRLPIKFVSAGYSFSTYVSTDGKKVFMTGLMLCDDDSHFPESVVSTVLTVFDLEEGGEPGSEIIEIRSGVNHFIFRLQNGSVFGFGCNDFSSIGKGAKKFEVSEILIPGGRVIKKMFAMDRNSMFISKNDGILYYLGQDMSIPLLNNTQHLHYDTPTPLLSPGDDGDVLIDVTASINHILAISKTKVYCIGENSYYQCGIIPRKWVSEFRECVIDEFSTHQVTKIVASSEHAVALISSENVYTFGVNWFGQLGTGTFLNHFFPVSIQYGEKGYMSGPANFINAAANSRTTLLLNREGQVYSFGGGDDGATGLDTLATVVIPSMVDPEYFGGKCVSIHADSSHSHAITVTGKLFSWGTGKSGELGTGQNKTFSPFPILVDFPEFDYDSLSVISMSSGRQSNLVIACEKKNGSCADEDGNRIFLFGLISVIGSSIHPLSSSLSESAPTGDNDDGVYFGIHFSPIELKDFPDEVTDFSLVQAGVSWILAVSKTFGDGRFLYILGVVGSERHPPIEVYPKPTLYWIAPSKIVSCECRIHVVCVVQSGEVYGMGPNDFNQLLGNPMLLKTPSLTYYRNFTKLKSTKFGKDNDHFSRVFPSDYTTILLTEVECYGIFDSDLGTVCSGQGVCVATNSCLCYNGYSGAECDVYCCDKIPYYNPNVCGGHGDCFSVDFCICNEKWSNSPQVTDIFHFRKNVRIENSCESDGNHGNHGNGYGFCKYPICPVADYKICSGHGSCNTSGNEPTCNCDENFRGITCHLPRCNGANGMNKKDDGCPGVFSTCISPNFCKCDTGSQFFNVILPIAQSSNQSLGCRVSWKLAIYISILLFVCCFLCCCFSCFCVCCFSFTSMSGITVARLSFQKRRLEEMSIIEKNFYEYPDRILFEEFNIAILKKKKLGSINSPSENMFLIPPLYRDDISIPIGVNHVFHGTMDEKGSGSGTIFFVTNLTSTFSENLCSICCKFFNCLFIFCCCVCRALCSSCDKTHQAYKGRVKMFPVFGGKFRLGKKDGFGEEYHFSHDNYSVKKPSDFGIIERKYLKFSGKYEKGRRHGHGREFSEVERISLDEATLEGVWDHGTLISIISINYPLPEIGFKDLDFEHPDIKSCSEEDNNGLEKRKVIGEGKFSVIFKAVLKKKSRLVAVKVFKDPNQRKKSLKNRSDISNVSMFSGSSTSSSTSAQEEIIEVEDKDDDRERPPEYLLGSIRSDYEASMRGVQNFRVCKEIGNLLKRIRMFGDHPNIVHIFGWSGPKDTMSRFLYVMELCDISVLDYYKKHHGDDSNKMSLKLKDKTLYQCAQGMHHLHQNCGLIHRDLKLDNLLYDVASSGEVMMNVKICDFNLGLTDFFEGKKKKKGAAGSAFQIAPEAILDGEFDASCDVYSFGIMMYELYFDQVGDPFDIVRTGKCWVCGESISKSRSLVDEMEKHHMKHANTEEGFRPRILTLEKKQVSEHAEEEEEEELEGEEHEHGDEEKEEKSRFCVGDQRTGWRIRLMKMCWAQNPSERPSFKEVSKVFAENIRETNNNQQDLQYIDDDDEKAHPNPSFARNSFRHGSIFDQMEYTRAKSFDEWMTK